MLSIYNAESDSIAKDYATLILTWVKSRIDRKRIKRADKIELLTDIEFILTGKPEELLKFSKKYNKLFPKKKLKIKGKSKFVTDSRVSYIFNYKEFRTRYGYYLANKLDITCCPYCNRNFTTSHETVKEDRVSKKVVFPEFDHFYPKSDHPFLAISFFNLIPSCNVCNTHYKGSKDPVKRKLLHPYDFVKPSSFNFKFYPDNYKALIGKEANIKLDFVFNGSDVVNESIQRSLDFFDIKAIYEKCHSGIIKDIIDKRIAYSDKYLSELQTSFKLSFEDSYKILFETHYEEQSLHKRPFSKLKKDIYNDFEVSKHLL